MPGEITVLCEAITADNQTQEQLEIRLLKGDLRFLSDPITQMELHDFFRRARDVAVNIAAHSGDQALAQQLGGLYSHEREIA